MFSLGQWQRSRTWENWVGYIQSAPSEKLAPKSTEELASVVRRAQADQRQIRVVGAGHSFSPIARPDDIAVTLHHMRGLVSVNKEAQEVTLRAGTYLYEVGPLLAPYGLALANMGDVHHQTLAGAVCSGTHGSGIEVGSISSFVVQWSWIDGKGELQTHRRGEDSLSQALMVSMGLLGIFVELTLKVVPLFGLREEACRIPFDQALASLQEDVHTQRHMEWFLFPGTDIVQKKTLSPIEPKAMSGWQHLKDRWESTVVLNGVFYVVSEWVRMYPKYARAMSKLAANNIPNTVREGYSYEVFPKPRGVRFNETEYFVPYAQAESCLREVQQALACDTRNSHFPIEVRSHPGEPGMLSATQGQDSLCLSFHMYKGMEDKPYFLWVQDCMRAYDGRPHWGKVSHETRARLAQLFPRLEEFLQIRAQQDPDKVFMNEHFESRLLGP